MPSSMLLPNPSEHCPHTAVGKNDAVVDDDAVAVRASASCALGIGPVVSVSVLVSARFHSSTAWR